jgi:hypothetical protein
MTVQDGVFLELNTLSVIYNKPARMWQGRLPVPVYSKVCCATSSLSRGCGLNGVVQGQASDVPQVDAMEQQAATAAPAPAPAAESQVCFSAHFP